ncbi:hypothetical protein JNB_14633 [Janibacter sp. HTCC2649]|uniref:hypothetical protein n=1 Tax=Janibacter sp. HTCC2649 TaxID=313589 RepID=UPI0000671946|nr:hypothetical protein [Janibacter sp. HTCC2649]EAP98209.1 hypothetical protein JNB_14633 [Janibacter sp. HTCC2649]
MSEKPSPSFAPGRRALLRGGAALGTVATLGTVAGAPAHAATTRQPVLVGANPGIQHYDAEGACTAYASVWKVDWSTHGSGAALILATTDSLTIVSEQRELAQWLWSDYTRYFGEIGELPPLPEPKFRRQHVGIDIDLATGLVARAGDITVRMNGVLDRRWVDVPEFELGGRIESLNFVVAPCGDGSISVAGHRLPGAVVNYNTPAKPWTSAYLSKAEVWRA